MRTFVAVCLVAVGRVLLRCEPKHRRDTVDSPGSTTVPAGEEATAVVVSSDPSAEVAPAAVEYSVSIDVSIGSADLDEELDVAIEPTELDVGRSLHGVQLVLRAACVGRAYVRR